MAEATAVIESRAVRNRVRRDIFMGYSAMGLLAGGKVGKRRECSRLRLFMIIGPWVVGDERYVAKLDLIRLDCLCKLRCFER